MHAGKGARRLLVLAGAGILPVCAQAAPPTPPPGTPTPGAIGDSLKPPATLQPPVQTPGITPPRNPAAAQGGAQGATLTVTHFSFSGNTLFGDAVLAPLVAEYVNHPITLAQLYEAADKVADFYAHEGYSLASVNVPAQKVKDGDVRLEVIEGRIGKIGFEGEHWYREEILHDFARHVRPGQVYRNGPLEQDLQALNALPGLAARAVIQPGAGYGSSDIAMKVQESPIDGYVVTDNYGRKDTGEYRLSASVTVNNPGRIADQLTVLGTHSSDNRLNYGYFDYNAPLNFRGTRFDVNFGHAYFDAAPFNVPGRNNNLQLNLLQSWVRTSTDTFSTSAGFLHSDGNADFAGAALSHTNINLLNLGLSWSHIWADSAMTQYSASVHTNFSHSYDDHSIIGGYRDRELLRLELNMQHLQPLPARLQLLALVDTVYSPNPLADTEQMSIGGPTTVRGFPASEARGDRGFFGQLTLRRPWTFGKLALVPRVYVDTGVVVAKHFGMPNTHSSLTSAGTGADLIYRSVDLKVDWAYPFDSKPVSDGRNDGRVYAALSVGF